MNYDMSSYFEDPEFKEALAKYEGMVENHTPAYFEADELIDIAEYYTLKGRHKDAEQGHRPHSPITSRKHRRPGFPDTLPDAAKTKRKKPKW